MQSGASTKQEHEMNTTKIWTWSLRKDLDPESMCTEYLLQLFCVH